MRILSDREFWIDGGVMFGLIPRVMWSKHSPPDSFNRVRLTTNSVLVERGGDWMLVEAGMGDMLPEKEGKYLNLQPGATLLDRLAEAGVAPEDVRWVVLTHLHFDHSGWCTRPDGKGGFTPTFPKAEYIVQSRQLAHALYPSRRERGSYKAETFEPVSEAGLWKPVQGIADVAPGVRVVPTDGHCPGHQVVLMEEDDATYLYPGDLIPTANHIGATYGMAFDVFPNDVVAQKLLLLDRACNEGWRVIWCHDTNRTVTQVARDERGEFVVA